MLRSAWEKTDIQTVHPPNQTAERDDPRPDASEEFPPEIARADLFALALDGEDQSEDLILPDAPLDLGLVVPDDVKAPVPVCPFMYAHDAVKDELSAVPLKKKRYRRF